MFHATWSFPNFASFLAKAKRTRAAPTCQLLAKMALGQCSIDFFTMQELFLSNYYMQGQDLPSYLQ